MAEGATIERLEAAVVGASANDWLRNRAKVPFAVVFASLASVERFAHEGRRVLDARAVEARREAEERRKDREWREQCGAVRAPPPQVAEMLGRLLRPRMISQGPPSTEADIAERKAEQLARLEALSRAAAPQGPEGR